MKAKKSLIFAFAIYSSLAISGPQPIDDCDPPNETEKKAKKMVLLASAGRVCPNSNKLDKLCDALRDRFEEKDEDSPNLYLYQTIIQDAACVDTDNDTPNIAMRKIQELWRRHGKNISCDSADFNVQRGSILKFGVAKMFDEFIEDVAINWKVDLNQVDASDNKTVLDYVESELKKAKGTNLEPLLKKYYTTLRNAGAKHRRELN